jgi:hypothetical protein
MNAPSWVLVISLVGLGILNARADPNSTALEKLRNIPLKTSDVKPIDSENLPMLILTEKGAFIFVSENFYSIDKVVKKTPLPFDQVLNALAALPINAWPQGRVILFYPKMPGQQLIGFGSPPAPAVKQVEAALKTANISRIRGNSD